MSAKPGSFWSSWRGFTLLAVLILVLGLFQFAQGSTFLGALSLLVTVGLLFRAWQRRAL